MSGIDIDSFLDLSQLSSLDDIELCEVLWLAKYMKTDKELYIPQNNDKKRHTSEHKPSKNNPLPAKQNETMSKTEVKTTYSEDVNEQNIPLKIDNNASNNDTVAIHHKGYFDDSGQLSTYLIDFRQKIFSRKRDILDEEKTVDNFVQTNIFLPFFKAKKQSKYELYIFIDKSNSMDIWEEMLDVYRKLLENSGVFKATRIVYFNTTKAKTYFYRDKLETKSFNPKEIINYHNNKIIFILTDMLSEAWKQGDALKKFANLNKSVPLFLVQMLPYRLWRSTLLQKASITTLNATVSYPKNKNYQSEVDFLLDLEDSDMQSLKLPIIDFNLAYLKKIGKVLNAKENNHIDGAIFDSVENTFIEHKEEKYLSAQDHIDTFFANASKKARELAISLSAVPLNLPIIRMIQEKVLKESSNLHIAEILNSTLLEKNEETFEFKTINGEDIGEIFLKLLGREKALEILYNNSEYIEENLHTNFSFKALLAGEIDLDEINIEGNDKVFASIACKVLQRLGKDYAKRAGCSGQKGGKKSKEHIPDIVEKLAHKPSKSIRVVGVGGGGGNMINHMIQEGINDIDLIVSNTDAQALDSSLAPYKLQLGISATKGLGAGMISDKGREAALENFEDIKTMLEGSDIVFITAGLGGGTGTGAAPIIAQAAKEIGALTVSIVTSPFKFEGRQRTKLAKEGLEELKRESDSIIVVPNEKLLSIVDKNLDIKESFRMVDDILAQAVSSISKLILSDGENDINLDFADVKTIMNHRGLALMGTGYSTGSAAAYDAAKIAIESPLLDNISIDGAMGVLVQFDIHPDYPLNGISEAMEIIYDSADEDGDVIFGTTTNADMDIDEVRVTMIITGLEKLSELEIRNKVVKQLKDQGWDDSEIKLEYKIENKYWADIVLMQENNPVSVIEVKYSLNAENMDNAIKQVVSYAKELNVSIAYITDGKKIYEYDIARKIYDLIHRYPSSIEFEYLVSTVKERRYLTLLPLLNINESDYYLENEKQIQDFSYSINERNFLVLNGNAGVGKTTFIINFINKTEQHYDYIAYIKNTDNFFRNLKDQLLESMSFDIEDTIDDIINKLSLLEGNKILVLDDVDDDVAKYEDYLIKLADANWKIILISRVEYFNFKRIGEEVQNDIYYHTLYPHTYEELSTIFKKSIIGNSYPKTGKVFTILDGLTDKKLLQVGSGLSNDFEILALLDLHEIFMHNGIRSTRVLSYYEGRPHIVDMIMNSEVNLIILQISPNMTKDELHHIFMIFQTAQQNDVPLIVDTKQLDKFISDLTLVYYECIECDRLDTFTCNELEWETISGSERNMGHESEHQAIYEDTCSKCNNEIEIKLSCWEYPIGAEDTRDINARGARIIQGDCCPDFHNDYGEEPTEDDEYSNLKRDIEIKEMEEKEFDDFIGQTIEDNNTTNNSLKINKRWWGNWETRKDRNWFEQDLFITRVDENGFDFELICINGSHIGDINGYAKFISLNEAKFENREEDEKETCRLYFHKINETMKITEENCSEYHGVQAYFDGNYELKKDVFVKYNEIADDRVLSNIYSLIGKKYWGKFQQCFSGIRGMDDLDNLGVNIITGTVPGLNSIQESIIMVDEANNVWGSFINDEDDKVYYFTSLLEWKKKLPLTIEEWRKNFKEKELVLIDDISIKDNVYHEFEDEDDLEYDNFSNIEKDYNLLIIDTNLDHLNIIKNSFKNKRFNPDRLFPSRMESEDFMHDIQILANNNNIVKLRDYIVKAIKNFNIHGLVIEPILGDEDITHPNDAIGSKLIAALEKTDEYKKLPIFVLSNIRKYAMVDNLIVSDNILLAEKPYTMSLAEMDDVLDENIIDNLNDRIIKYLEFTTGIKSSKELTLVNAKENLHDDIYDYLSEIINDEFKDYNLDAEYLPEGIDEVIITEIYMPEELEFIKLINNDDTYILDIKFETEAFVWMLVDKNHHDYISLKPLPVKDHNKQFYSTESEEILFVEISIEFKIDKNGKIKDLLIDSIDDVVLLEDEHSDEREQDIKDQISDEITSILKTEHFKELDYFQVHDESLPSDDHSALISSYDLPKKVEIENIEIFSNQFDAKIYLEEEVYLDIHILKNEYYSNEEYVSLYGTVEELNKHYVTVECHALISIELNIQGTRDKDIDSVDALDIDIVDISVIEQIPIDDKADFDSSGIHKTSEEFDKSFDTFYEAVGINPNDASYFYDLGQTYLKVKSYDRAVEVFLKAIRLDSYNSTYYEQLGIVYLEINKYSQALESFRKALSINSDLVESWINMGVIYYNQSKHLKVIDVFTKILKVNQKIHYKELARDIINSNSINEFIKSTILVNLSRLNLSQVNELHKIIQQDLPIYIGQILSSSYAIIIQLSKEDKQNLLNEIVWIDIRQYGIDKYLRNPNENETTKYDKDRFINILGNIEKKNWQSELRLNNFEPAKELGITYLTSKVFTPIKNYQEIQEIKNWFLDNYKKPNAFPIKFGEKDLQTFDDLKNTIFSQFETQYDTDIINHTINEIKEEYGDIAWEQKSFLRVETKDGNIKHLDADSYKEYVDSVVGDKLEKEKLLNKNRYLLCEIINLTTLYMLKIKLNKNDKQRIFKGQLTIDIRDYYEIYNDLKSQTNDKLIKNLERKCWKIDLKIIEDNIGDSNIMYLSKNIFEYTPKPSILDTISPIEKKLIQFIRDYDRYIYLTDFTQLLSQKLKIPRNKVIKILYRWRVFEKIDLAKESCISDLEINRNALAYILSLEI